MRGWQRVGELAHAATTPLPLLLVAVSAWLDVAARCVAPRRPAPPGRFNNATAIYGNSNGDGLQSAHAASLGINVVPAAFKAAVQANLVKDIVTTHDGHWFAGITGEPGAQRRARGDVCVWEGAPFTVRRPRS